MNEVFIFFGCDYPEIFRRTQWPESVNRGLDKRAPCPKKVKELLGLLWCAQRIQSVAHSTGHYDYVCVFHFVILGLDHAGVFHFVTLGMDHADVFHLMILDRTMCIFLLVIPGRGYSLMRLRK